MGRRRLRRTKKGTYAKVGNVADRLFGSLQADSSKARDLLGWRPVVFRDEALMFHAKYAKVKKI